MQLRGIDDIDRLRRWLSAKGYRYLVFRIADVLDMEPDDQMQLAALCKITNERRAWQRAAIGGYVRVPMVDVLDRSLEQLQAIQALIHSYRETRMLKGEPSESSPCDCTHDATRPPQPQCRACDGTGTVVTFVEMSAEETALAVGERI